MQTEMRFEARSLKPFAEPVDTKSLREGHVYFSLNFVDTEMFLPTLEPVVFAGRNLEPGDVHKVYFQDAGSYLQGVRYNKGSAVNPSTFYCGDESSVNHIFDFERALDVLLACSIRRKAAGK